MAPLSDVSIVELKTCPRCEESLPLSEFGICRARKDGLNLYCKRCIRQKIALSRAALREYKNARVKHGASSTDRSRLAIDAAGFSPRRIARMLRKLSPADRVREAIRCGARTQKQIAVEICLTSNDLILGVKGDRHPFPVYRKYGVPVVIATDDEGVSRSDMTHEYVRAVQAYGLTYAELKKIVRDSIAYSFVEPPVRAKLLSDLDARFREFEGRKW